METADATWPPPALSPAGPFARPLVDTSWMLFGMGAVVFLVVCIALAIALFGGPGLKRWIAQRRFVVAAGLAFPVVVLSAVLVYGLTVTARMSAPPAASDLRIRVVAEMWWWRVTYFEGERALFETANEIRIPVGRPVRVDLQSADVIHSFWAPELAAKLDMIPGRTNVLRIQADRAGVYRGQCTEFCGAAHALMAFEVVAEPETAHLAWRARQATPRLPIASPGAAVFDRAGCGACHTVRGTDANGRLGPDLTHFAERRKLAAGILDNDPETLRRWLRDADALKPGVRMPFYGRLCADELEAVAQYLEAPATATSP